MVIVVLDGYTLNPGDLDWNGLKALGNCTIYDRTPKEEIIERARESDIVLTNKTPLSASTIRSLDRLQYIGLLATGYDVVDVQATRKRDIPVTNVPTYATQSVAQLTMAHLLNLTNRVVEHAQTVSKGKWSESEDFCYWDYPLIELEGLTFGVIGFGRIGRSAAELAYRFGMNILAYDPMVNDHKGFEVSFVDLEEIFSESDVVSLHCPLTDENKELVSAERIDLMKNSAFLINTSRGPLVDEEALVKALNSEKIAGAGLDVLEQEPPAMNNSLFEAKNCYITPHIAWATRSARKRLLNTAVQNVKAFLDKNSMNVVN